MECKQLSPHRRLSNVFFSLGRVESTIAHMEESGIEDKCFRDQLSLELDCHTNELEQILKELSGRD